MLLSTLKCIEQLSSFTGLFNYFQSILFLTAYRNFSVLESFEGIVLGLFLNSCVIMREPNFYDSIEGIASISS